MVKLNGLLSITRVCGESEHAMVKLTDAVSGCVLVVAEVKLVNFAGALFGLAYVPCVLNYDRWCPVGKVRESKVEWIAVPASLRYGAASQAQLRGLIAEFEVDDWRVNDINDLFNVHERSDGHRQPVTFVRFVEFIKPVVEAV